MSNTVRGCLECKTRSNISLKTAYVRYDIGYLLMNIESRVLVIIVAQRSE